MHVGIYEPPAIEDCTPVSAPLNTITSSVPPPVPG